MSYLEPILVHPVRRQIFGDTSGQTFYMTRDPVLTSADCVCLPVKAHGQPALLHKLTEYFTILVFLFPFEIFTRFYKSIASLVLLVGLSVGQSAI